MRVNPDMSGDVLAAIWQTQNQENTALQQMSIGKRVNVPSDDPLAAAQMVGNQDQSNRADQYLQNIDTLTNQLQTADTALGSAVTAVTQAITLGVQGSTGTLSSSKPAADRAESAGDSKSTGAVGQHLGRRQLSCSEALRAPFLPTRSIRPARPASLTTATAGPIQSRLQMV